MKRHLRSMPFWGFTIAAAVVVLASGGILACDTPVYRYAMYRWEPAPYEIYYFHDAEIAPEVAELHQVIEDASRDEKQPANVILIPAHVKDDPELKRIPPDVRKLWNEQEDPEIPVYLFVSPHGTLLRQGELDLRLLKQLLDSPVRQKVAAQLEKGCAGVMVMLTGSDAEANRNAKQVVQKLQKDIADGEIELYLPPPMFGPPGEEAPEAPTIEIGFCELQRDSKEEQWLVESLLSIESDLKDEEFASQPMIFCVFGRGRALPPFIGKGINADNLLNCVDFITGACSCTVKDQNPGMDLLFAKDWWTAAENLANAFGAEEGNEPQYGAADMFPDLIIPSDSEESDDAEMTEADQPPTDVATTAEADTPGGDTPEEGPGDEESAADAGGDAADATTAKVAGEESAEEATSESTSGSSAQEVAESTEPQATESTGGSEPDKTSKSQPLLAARDVPESSDSEAADAREMVDQAETFTSVFAVGTGLAVALVLLFGLTLVVLRPK